ncbi:MAG: YitT family protein [Clostridia bacterium]|nr:YitT family protein [Clostridia bacterium]
MLTIAGIINGFGISVGTFVMIYNILLYIICGFVIKSWILPLYSIITYAGALKTVDFIVEGIDRSKYAMIITVSPEEICKALSEEFECGVTRVEGIGGYSNTQKTVIYFVLNRFQVVKLKELVHHIDVTAYIIISDVADVFSANQK